MISTVGLERPLHGVRLLCKVIGFETEVENRDLLLPGDVVLGCSDNDRRLTSAHSLVLPVVPAFSGIGLGISPGVHIGT